MAKSDRDKIFDRDIADMGAAISAMMEGKRDVSQDNNFSSKLDKVLEEITESTKVKNQIEALVKLQGNDNQGDVFKQLSEAGLPLSELIGVNQEQTKTMQQLLDKERQRRLESEEKALKVNQQNKSQEMNMMMKMFEMQMENQKQQMDSFKDLVVELKNEIKEVKNGSNSNNSKSENDPIKTATQKLLNEAIDEKLNTQYPDPFEQIMYNKERLNALQEIFGGNNIDKNKLDLKHQIELKKIELEDNWRREEAQRERELEEKKLQKWDVFIGSLQQVLPAVAQAVASNNGQESNQSSKQEQSFNKQSMSSLGGVVNNNLICRQCGRSYTFDNAPNVCECGVVLFEETEEEVAQHE